MFVMSLDPYVHVIIICLLVLCNWPYFGSSFFFIECEDSLFASVDFMKWIMVFISLLIIMIIECACCHLYCLSFYALPLAKIRRFILLCFSVVIVFYGRSTFSYCRIYAQNIVFLWFLFHFIRCSTGIFTDIVLAVFLWCCIVFIY